MSVGSYHKQSASSGLISLQADQSDLKAFADFAALVPKAAAAAQRRAINRTLRWLRTHVARAVSRQEKVAVGAVRQRLRAYPVGSSGQGKLWFGINPIEASRAGRPRQSRSGVSVAGRRYEGRSTGECMAVSQTSGFARPASTSRPATTPTAKSLAVVVRVRVGSVKTAAATRWPKPRYPWMTCARTSSAGPSKHMSTC